MANLGRSEPLTIFRRLMAMEEWLCRSSSPRRSPTRRSPSRGRDHPGARHCPAAAADDAGARGNVSARAGGRRRRRVHAWAATPRASTPPTRSARSRERSPPGSSSCRRSACDRRFRRRRSLAALGGAALPRHRAARTRGQRPGTRGSGARDRRRLLWPATVAHRRGRGDSVLAAVGPRAARQRRLQVRAVPRIRATSRPCCAPARSSTTRKARRRPSACGGSPARRRSPSTARSTRRTPATC